VDPTPGPGRDAVRARWGLTPAQPVVPYTGTFEQYQGLDLLLVGWPDGGRRGP